MPMVRVSIQEIVGFVGGHLYRLSTRKEDGFGIVSVEMSWFSIMVGNAVVGSSFGFRKLVGMRLYVTRRFSKPVFLSRD